LLDFHSFLQDLGFAVTSHSLPK